MSLHELAARAANEKYDPTSTNVQAAVEMVGGWPRMQGRSHYGDVIDVPLISPVADNFWQGGCMNGLRLPTLFKHVVSLYPWEQYVLPEGCDRVEIKMYDSGTMVDEDDLYFAADTVVDFVKDGPTLVHCQAGLNRSGLVAGLALIKMGKTPQEAVDLLRRRRQNPDGTSPVLCNPTFAQWLLDYAP